MCICCNPDADFHDTCGMFVTPSAGKKDWCGRNCGPLSFCCMSTQLVLCGRDPNSEDAAYDYDDDANKMMCCRCCWFGVLCFPLCFAIDAVGTVVRISTWFCADDDKGCCSDGKGCCCACCNAGSSRPVSVPSGMNMKRDADGMLYQVS